MKHKFLINRLSQSISLKLILGLALAISSCHKTDVIPRQLNNFKQINLVANRSEYNPKTIDQTLINGFGMAWSPTGIAWVNSVGGHVSELYNAEGSIVRAPVNIPSRTDTINGLPTGIVFSGGKGFQSPGGSAAFLFSGFDGVISGWNGAAGLNAKRLKTPPSASYTGLTIAANGKNNLWIVVPCHRVIGSDGSLTGYAGGLWRKQWLLEHEATTLGIGQIKMPF